MRLNLVAMAASGYGPRLDGETRPEAGRCKLFADYGELSARRLANTAGVLDLAIDFAATFGAKNPLRTRCVIRCCIDER